RLAAVEVLVPAGLGEPVEPGDRVDQGLLRNVDFPGQFGDRGGLVRRAGLVPTARESLPGPESGEQVPVAVALVGDQPGRNVLGRTVAGAVHRVHRVDVGRCLVDEALSLAVHQDAARQGAFGQAEVRATGEWDGRAPPGVV